MKSITVIICIITLLLTGCSSGNQYGQCVGIGETQNPNLTYKISGWNLAMGIVFFELIVPPVLVVTDEFYCPKGVKQ